MEQEPVRKRIVINLDGPPGARPSAGTRRRRWPKVLAVLALLLLIGVVVVVAGAFFGWRYYQSTPSYSVALILDAAQRNDMPELEKFIDDEAISQNLLKAVSEKAAGRYGSALSGTVQSQIDNVLPSLMPSVRQIVRDEVAKEVKEFASKSEPKAFLFVALAVPSFVTLKTEGDTAHASAPISDRTMEFTLKRNADRWKIVEVKDDTLTQKVVDGVVKELPAIGGPDKNTATPRVKPRRSRGRNR
jgi:hypothetical protein